MNIKFFIVGLYLVLMLLLVGVVLRYGGYGTATALSPSLLMQWGLAIFLSALELAFVFFIWLGTGPSKLGGINLERLVSEQDGAASFSRFQFLIFTFVIASAYIVLAFAAVAAGNPMPDISAGVLGLMGISGGSYLVSKGMEGAKGNAGDAAEGATGAAATTGTTPSALPGDIHKP